MPVLFHGKLIVAEVAEIISGPVQEKFGGVGGVGIVAA